MENVKITKEFADNLMAIKGNIRGGFFIGYFKYVRNLKGDEGVKKIEKKLENLGYSIKEKEIKNIEWYAEALACLMILITVEAFNFQKEDVFQMGKESPKHSFVVRFLMSHFLTPERSFKEAPKYWKENYDFGYLETIGFSQKEKYGIFRIKNFRKKKYASRYHPLFCEYQRGYFLGIAEMAIPAKNLKIEHTKCILNGQDEEEYKITWE